MPDADAVFFLLHEELGQLVEAGSISETGYGSEYFSLSPGTLTEGLEYSFRATLKDQPSVYSEITVTARAAPRGGGALASPLSGVAGQTVFTITAQGWESQGSSLTYEFWHLSGDMEQALSAQLAEKQAVAASIEAEKKVAEERESALRVRFCGEVRASSSAVRRLRRWNRKT